MQFGLPVFRQFQFILSSGGFTYTAFIWTAVPLCVLAVLRRWFLKFYHDSFLILSFLLGSRPLTFLSHGLYF